jgi:tRNA(Ile2) C34 agmatinyltransferase TiaS
MAVCPHCKQDIPRSMMDKTVIESLVGGWTCPKCGYEIDWSGKVKGPRPIEPKQETPLRSRRIALSLVSPLIIIS